MDNLLAGKNALITGAGSNIGRSTAVEMAGQGANVFFTDVDKEKCMSLERELGKYRVVSKGLVSDVSKTESTDSLFDYLSKNGIKVDILVNNVGVQDTKAAKKLDLEEWRKVFDTNILGPIYLTKLVSQMMISGNIRGSIIFITSIHQWTVRRLPAYSASKAALGMIIKEMALDLAPHGIRVNGIAPGYVGEGGDGKNLSHRYTPLHSCSINPCYIGRAAVYLASDYFSRFTTGTVIKIDAGLSLYNHLVDQIPLK